MRRKITEQLEQWASAPQKKPLAVFGARQVGKSTSILEFAQRCYDDVVEINFYKDAFLKQAFSTSLRPHDIIQALEALLNRDIVPGKTLLFLDEIQACDEALTSLKFFCTDAPEYDVIAAGSLLGVHVAGSGSFPVGYIDILEMHPMDFEEFAWACGKERLFDLVRDCFRTYSECPVHDSMLELYHDYLLVGGMPEAVLAHTVGERLPSVRAIQQQILDGYTVDIVKYASAIDSAKILAAWESMPAQLAKESGSTKFTWKTIESRANAEKYGSALDWLTAAGLVSKCIQVSEGVAPLSSFAIPASFKVYVEDTGLLSCKYHAHKADFAQDDHRSARFRGGMAENYVMQQLVAAAFRPYYWGQQSTYEVEFVLRLEEGVVPVEVKSGRRIKSTSTKRFAEKYDCPYLIHVSQKNFGRTESVRSIPLYAVGLLPNPSPTNSLLPV